MEALGVLAILFAFGFFLLLLRCVQQQRYIRELCRIIDQLEGTEREARKRDDSDSGDSEGHG